MATAAAGLAVQPSIFSRGMRAASLPSVVRATGGDSPRKLVEAAVSSLGGMSRFVARGNIVVVKPNIGWDRSPEQAANTNPEAVATVVEACLNAGAKRVHVFDRTCNDARRTYAHSGIAAAARAAGAEVSYVDENLYKNVTLNGVYLKEWNVYKLILECDTLINMPIAKHHGLSSRTLSMKNWMGVIGGNRGHFHHNMDQSLIDLAAAVKPHVTILDAYRILIAGGPTGGSLDLVQTPRTVIAGVDQIAVDAWACTLFPDARTVPGYLDMAKKLGLGEPDFRSLPHLEIAV